MTKKPLILISNDDGIEAKGLRHLIDCVVSMGIDADIVAVAPKGHCSGMSSALTVDRPLRIVRQPDYNGARMYYVTGTPVDCVKLGLHAVMPRRPDFMLSGINHGSNAGNSIIYSGTMGAALEACTIGIPAIGFSLLNHKSDADFSPCNPFITTILEKVFANGLPKDVCLNVNMPADCVPLGIKVTTAARGRWTEEYKRYEDPSGTPFYWLTGRFINEEPDNDATDLYWLKRNWISVTPAHTDQTDFDAIPALATLFG